MRKMRMNLDNLIAWCDPAVKPGERPEQTPATWQEITDALKELRFRRAADQPDAAHVHTFTLGVCTCGERNDAYLHY